MADNWAEAKAKLLSTDYPEWRIMLACLALMLLTTAMVLSWWYTYYTIPEAECHRGFLYLSVPWLIAQWLVIGYLYSYRDIPRFARVAMEMLIATANGWFGLFIISLKACAL